MIISCKEKEAVSYALEHLRAQKPFVYPTDTLYGFGVDARSEDALEALYEIKKRPASMPLSMLLPSIDMLKTYAEVSETTQILIDKFLPGALTLVLPSITQDLPKRLYSMEGYLGFRIPDHHFCLQLSQEFQSPFITTSVNVSGKPALTTMAEIQDEFADDIDLMIFDAQLDKVKNHQGSTVVMVDKHSRVKVLREGLISEKTILNVI